MKKKIIQFGAEKIGRSFMGQLFSANGYEVVFVDIDVTVIDAINKKDRYSVIIKENGKSDTTLPVTNIRRIMGNDIEAVIKETIDAELIVTSVGKNALPYIIPTIAAGIINRLTIKPSAALNIIFAENMSHGRSVVTTLLAEALKNYAYLLDNVGIIETSIGKMGSILPKDITDKNPLFVYGEPYNTFIIDKTAFLGKIPDIPHNWKLLIPLKHMLNENSYIHNMGHAAVAYFGYLYHPEYRYLYEVLEDTEIYQKVHSAMRQSAQALHAHYANVFSKSI